MWLRRRRKPNPAFIGRRVRIRLRMDCWLDRGADSVRTCRFEGCDLESGRDLGYHGLAHVKVDGSRWHQSEHERKGRRGGN